MSIPVESHPIAYKRPDLQQSSWLIAIAKRVFLVIAIYTIINLVTMRYSVEGISMQPDFDSGQLLLINRLHYVFTSPQRYDVVVFHNPRNLNQDYIKRIIGLPYEVVEIRNAQVYINGTPLYEPYLAEPCLPTLCADSIWQLGADQYFVMGDNRNHSQDSRYFGAVSLNMLLGEVILRYYPLNAMRWMNSPQAIRKP